MGDDGPGFGVNARLPGYVSALRKAHRQLRNRDGLGPEDAFSRLVNWLTGRDDDNDHENGADVFASLSGLRNGRGEVDVAAVALRTFVAGDLRKGLGLYITPDSVADRVAAAIGPVDGKRVIDPACGTGGLLLAIGRADGDPSEVCGIDRHGTVLAAARWALNDRFGQRLRLHQGDGLATRDVPDWAAPGSFDAVVCNPPFGIGVPREMAGPGIASTVSDGRTAGVPAHWLFLQRALELLGHAGIAAFVVPNGVLSNVRDQKARDYIAERAETVSIEALPEDTFISGGARVGTSIWTLRKRRPHTPVVSSPGPQTEQSVPPQRPTARLGDLCTDIRTGRTPGKAVYGDDGAFILKVGNLTGHGIDWHRKPRNFVSPSWPEKLARGRVWPLLTARVGDIVMTSTAHARRYIAAKVDAVTFVPDEYGEEVLFVGELLRLRPDPDRIDRRYLLAWLRQPSTRRAIQELARGQTAHLRPRDIAELPVPLPADDEKTADLLTAMDEAEHLHAENWRARLRLAERSSAVFGPPTDATRRP